MRDELNRIFVGGRLRATGFLTSNSVVARKRPPTNQNRENKKAPMLSHEAFMHPTLLEQHVYRIYSGKKLA
jgi:hypothetical protein